MEEDFTIEHIISIMKKTKKTDPLFKPLKKLKTALQNIGMQAVSFIPTSKIIAFHFGLGNQLDKQFILLTKPQNLDSQLSIIPGHSYTIMEFRDIERSVEFMSSKIQINDKPVSYQQIQYQNLSRTLIFMYSKKDLLNNNQICNIPNCEQKYVLETIPGLFLVEEIVTREEESELLQAIDSGKWQKLNNRRVQHHGFQFKYGRNQIDKEENKGKIPEYFNRLLDNLQKLDILKGLSFDQLTINDYFAGNGIPSHFDTHSPFEQFFISVSLLSGIVMEFKRYDGSEQSVYLKERSVAIFSGEARYAWTHGISCRKIDKINNHIQHRSRRISLTFRKIKFTPCQCPYFFYCDSQGYKQQTMKKNNPLLTKYLSERYKQELTNLSSQQIEKKYVQQAYNGFGFDFHNKVIEEIKEYIEKEVEVGDVVVDLGCGNGQYKKYVDSNVHYVSVEKCTTMLPVDGEIFMDGLKLSFRNQVIDKVLIIAVLHHFASEETRLQALRQIYRILSPKGIMYITVLSYQKKEEIYSSPQTILQYCLPTNKLQQKPNKNNLQIQVPRYESRGQIFKRYYHMFYLQQIIDLLKNAGFIIAECKQNRQNIIVKAIKP